MTPSSDYNVILINLDGLRNDKVELCPSLRLLKERSYYFPKMFTVAPYTFAALPAVFSGMYASKMGPMHIITCLILEKIKLKH